MIFSFLQKKLAAWDSCGTTPSLSYRREARYGTALGGISTIFGFIVCLLFIMAELYGFIVQPTYN